MNHNGITRRDFVQRVAAAGSATLIVPRHVLGGPGYISPNDKLNIACIGIGGKGESDVRGVASENIYALCDVDEKQGAQTFASFPAAKKYKDFREMLDKEQDHIDAVMVSTPDHTHAVASMMAIKLGKHVFCQKPLTHTIFEARTVAEAARKAGVATQMGIQGHAWEGIRLIREWIEAGLIGTVGEIYYWTDRPIWPQAIKRPEEEVAVPDTLDWDLWLGPMAFRPYHPDFYAPFNWRGWWDFGTGALGDIACHAMDAAFWTFGLGYPSRITAETTPKFLESPPACSRITYDFPAKGDRYAIRVVWMDGHLMPPRPSLLAPSATWPEDNGQMFVGTEGLIVAGPNGQDPYLIPESLQKEVAAHPIPQTYPRSPGHYEEWIAACKGGETPGANFPDFAGPLTEMVLLGNLAVRTGETIEWDAENMRVKNVSTPNGYLHIPYRDGWTL